MTAHDERIEIARKVANALRLADIRSMLRAITDAHGEHPIIAAHPDERMGYVFDRLRDHPAGAFVASFDRDDELTFISMVPAKHKSTPQRSSDDPCPIHADSTVAMLLALLRTVRGPIMCHEANPDVQFELIDGSGPQHIPA